MNRVDHPDVKICTPVEAYGMESDVTMFVGLDAESWSMKPEQIQRIDDFVRVELGLTDGDLRFIARHLFKSLLSTSQQAIFLIPNMMSSREFNTGRRVSFNGRIMEI